MSATWALAWIVSPYFPRDRQDEVERLTPLVLFYIFDVPPSDLNVCTFISYSSNYKHYEKANDDMVMVQAAHLCIYLRLKIWQIILSPFQRHGTLRSVLTADQDRAVSRFSLIWLCKYKPVVHHPPIECCFCCVDSKVDIYLNRWRRKIKFLVLDDRNTMPLNLVFDAQFKVFIPVYSHTPHTSDVLSLVSRFRSPLVKNVRCAEKYVSGRF